MPKRQANRARPARKSSGDIIAESKKEPDVAPKSTTPGTSPIPDVREQMLITSLAAQITRLQSLLSKLPKLNIPLPPPTIFTDFPKLPPELRNKIWKFASMVPRNINLRLRNYSAGGHNDQPETPAILLTCSEARKEGKRYYMFCREIKEIRRRYPLFMPLLSRDRKLDPRLRSAARICRRNTVWINFAADRFTYNGWVHSPMEMKGAFCFEDDVVNRIQHLSLSAGGVYYDHRRNIYDTEGSVGCFQNLVLKNPLKELTLRAEEYPRNRLPDGLVMYDHDLQEKKERYAVRVTKGHKKAGWKVSITLEQTLNIGCDCCVSLRWGYGDYVLSTSFNPSEQGPERME